MYKLIKNALFNLTMLFILLGGVINNTATAHTVGLSQGKYQLLNMDTQTLLKTELIFARNELNNFINLDINADGVISNPELSKKNALLEEKLIAAINVNTDSGNCSGKLKQVSLVEADGIQLNADFYCKQVIQEVAVDLNFFSELARGHRHVITKIISNEVITNDVAYLGKATFQLITNNNSTDTIENQKSSSALSFLAFGFEHIITGYDHLLFLLGLVLITVSFKQLFLAVTAFTVAHSITLGLSVLGIFVPSAGFIEPLIALSIVYVGVENCVVRNFNKRWVLTFVFGLIHGFGFAGAIQDIALSKDQLPWVLLNFNLGVETGQVLVILMVFPLLIWLRRKLWINSQTIAALNIGLVVVGTYWFLDRTNLLVV